MSNVDFPRQLFYLFPPPFFFFNPPEDMFIDLRERNIDVREKQQSIAFCTCPDWESNLQPFGIRMMLQPTEPPSQGPFILS